jgi:hypothetical protein
MPKKTITDLVLDFETAIAAIDAQPYPRSGTKKKQFDAAINKASELASRIVTMPAASIDEMLLKIRVAGWASGALPPLHNWRSTGFIKTEALDCLVSLREDLRRMLDPPRRRARHTGVRTRVGHQVVRT